MRPGDTLTDVAWRFGIDVDTIVARHGADALKLDAVHLKPQGYSLLAREVVRVLDDLGVLDTAIQ